MFLNKHLKVSNVKKEQRKNINQKQKKKNMSHTKNVTLTCKPITYVLSKPKMSE